MALLARSAWLALAAALLLPGAAMADSNEQHAGAAWRQADTCARAAFKLFPDYTPEGNAKREAARLACLRDHRLPGSDAAGAPPAVSGDSQ